MTAQQPDHGGQLWRVVDSPVAKRMGSVEALCHNLAARGEYDHLAQKLGVPISAENFETVMANLQLKKEIGILVRERRAANSVLHDEPLAYNALVKEIELVGNQLCFELVEGTGPPTGWVHISPDGDELLVKTNSRGEREGGNHVLVKATEADTTVALPRRKCHLMDDSPPWYEKLTTFAEFEQHEELNGVLSKYYVPLKSQMEHDSKDVLWDHFARDESGFVHGDGDPLHFLSEDELNRADGEEYVVVHKCVAVRRSPSEDGKVIGTKKFGDHLTMFESDLTNEWRCIHFTLRGGWGSTVKAWVMMVHPEVGTLVRPYRAEVAKPANVKVLAHPAETQPGSYEEGELHEVLLKRLAIRDNPSPKGNMLGQHVQGETVLLYEWDSEKVFRRCKFKLPDGRGEVDAWVMIQHPKLGTLLRPVAKGADVDVNICQRCGTFEEGMGDIGLCDVCFSLG